MGDGGVIGCEHPIEDWDLFGVDGPFAAETQVPCTVGFMFHAVGIFQVQIRDIDGIDAGAGSGVNDARTGIEQGLPGIPAPQLGRHVDTAEEEGVDARAGLGNVVRGLETGIGLDNDVQPDIVAALGQDIVEPNDFIRRHYLRQHQGGRRCIGGENDL